MAESKLPPADAPRPHVLITGGPTVEDIDPVRYVANKSSGRMGIELAAAVKRTGGTPLLILGPTHLCPPDGVTAIHVRSAEDMCREVVANLGWADGLFMSAAVADYTPAEPQKEKIKKHDGDLLLRLKRTPDILHAIKDRPERIGKFIVGFSLDIDVNLSEGRRKLAEKKLDLIVVNTTASFGADHVFAHLIAPEGVEDCGEIGKAELSERLVSRLYAFYAKDKP